MEKKANLVTPLLLLFSLITISSGAVNIKLSLAKSRSSLKLFVFGDSYVDTGNWNKNTMPWKLPFGVSLNGPTGRFSDGLTLTDYIGMSLGVEPPIPYELRRTNSSRLNCGMNFAYGGSGVFTTWQKQNLTYQIHLLKKLMEQNVYTKRSIHNSIALVSINGNDYSFSAFQNNGNVNEQSMKALTKRVIKQLGCNLKSIYDLGVKRVAITSMMPRGCLPRFVEETNYANCSGSYNLLTRFYNHLLRKGLKKLNDDSKKSKYVILDLYGAFFAGMKLFSQDNGNTTYENPLKPCCEGVSSKYVCGDTDKNGENMFKVCQFPKSAFFWDAAHPSMYGWQLLTSALRPTAQEIFQVVPNQG